MKLRITKLDPSLTREDLREIFEEFGDVYTVRIFKDPANNPDRHFALVEMESISAGKKAIETITDEEYEGIPLQVEVFRDIIKTESGKPLGGPKITIPDDDEAEDDYPKPETKDPVTEDGEALPDGINPVPPEELEPEDIEDETDEEEFPEYDGPDDEEEDDEDEEEDEDPDDDDDSEDDFDLEDEDDD